jgi:hypothetical protein
VIHVGEHNSGIFPKVVGCAGVVRHLWNWDVSKSRITSHLFDQDVRSGDVLLVIGGADVSKLGPHPVAGRYDCADFQMFQENMLKLDDLFVGDVASGCEIEVAISFLVALLVEFRNPPTAN